MATSPSSDSSFLFELPDLTQPDDFSDVTLLVEERKLYACKGILACASPVWRQMFVADFKEKEAKEIKLPGKQFDDIVELLLCISPAIQKPITGDNVFRILPLADEYQMVKLKQDCERWLLLQLDSDSVDQDQQLKHLVMAQRYNLNHLLERCVDLVATLSVSELEQCAAYEDIDDKTMIRILKTRVLALEDGNGKLSQSADHWREKCEETQDCLMKLSREKLTIKRTLDDLEAAWEMKGSDTRCIDPVHIYGPRNYNCEMCTRQLHTYLQAKVWHLLNRGATSSGIAWPQ